MRELSNSLRTNAERLLRDVRLTHGAMTARLDQVTGGPQLSTRARTGADGETEGEREQAEDAREPTQRRRLGRRSSRSEGDDELDVPEFIPRR